MRPGSALETDADFDWDWTNDVDVDVDVERYLCLRLRLRQCLRLVSHFVNLFWREHGEHLNFSFIISDSSRGRISNLSHVTKNSFVLVVASATAARHGSNNW